MHLTSKSWNSSTRVKQQHHCRKLKAVVHFRTIIAIPTLLYFLCFTKFTNSIILGELYICLVLKETITTTTIRYEHQDQIQWLTYISWISFAIHVSSCTLTNIAHRITSSQTSKINKIWGFQELRPKEHTRLWRNCKQRIILQYFNSLESVHIMEEVIHFRVSHMIFLIAQNCLFTCLRPKTNRI